MAQEPLQRLVGKLRHSHGPDDGATCTDAALLGRWVAHRDQAAFTLLARRHTPMVLAVCRRVLHDEQEAEDATQAALLILARKAGTIGRRQAVAGWLHRVAYRTALLAQHRRVRCPIPNQTIVQGIAAASEDRVIWRDLALVLDAEIARLPEKCRVPFVLCHLEGRTNADAARELGCPEGTILSRLARARARLRTRLMRRGITLSAAALAATSAPSEAALPTAFVEQLTSAVSAALAPPITQLAEGVMYALLIEKLRRAAVFFLVLIALGGTGVGWLLFPSDAAQPPAQPQPKNAAALARPAPAPAQPAAQADQIRQKKQKLVELAKKTFDMNLKLFRNGQLADIDRLSTWSRRWLEAQLDVASAKDERLAAYSAHVARMRDVARMARAFANSGQARESDATAAEYCLVQAELRLEEAKAKAK